MHRTKRLKKKKWGFMGSASFELSLVSLFPLLSLDSPSHHITCLYRNYTYFFVLTHSFWLERESLDTFDYLTDQPLSTFPVIFFFKKKRKKYPCVSFKLCFASQVRVLGPRKLKFLKEPREPQLNALQPFLGPKIPKDRYRYQRKNHERDPEGYSL